MGSLPRVYTERSGRPWGELEVVRNSEAVTYRGRGALYPQGEGKKRE